MTIAHATERQSIFRQLIAYAGYWPPNQPYMFGVKTS
jgi:hypothetical protein